MTLHGTLAPADLIIFFTAVFFNQADYHETFSKTCDPLEAAFVLQSSYRSSFVPSKTVSN